MEQERSLLKHAVTMPRSFYDGLIEEVPPAHWVELLQADQRHWSTVFEGFSVRPGTISRVLKQPQVQLRLRSLLRSEPTFLELVVESWGLAQLPLVAFLEMMDFQFLLDNWQPVKNLLGPERFLACLMLLGYLDEALVLDRVNDEAFWQRELNPEALEILLPAVTLKERILAEYPHVGVWLGLPAADDAAVGHTKDAVGASAGKKTSKPSYKRERDRRVRVEKKLERSREAISRLERECRLLRGENEKLKRRLEELQAADQRRIDEALSAERRRWYAGYLQAGLEDPQALTGEADVLQQLLNRAERALALQRDADEKYGTVQQVAAELRKINLLLDDIERVYAHSLVVHPEVRRAAQALERAKRRLLDRPGVDKVFQQWPALRPVDDWRQRVRLLEPLPENLPKVTKFMEIVHEVEQLEPALDLDELHRELQQKKRQIQELLYQRFAPQRAPASSTAVLNLDDLVAGGMARRYDLYVDGYNILLTVRGGSEQLRAMSLSGLRDHFIDAVIGKGHLFRKIFLVFDGLDSSRDRRGNVEIIYSNKNLGITADAILIEALGKRRDRKSLLVTADEEIIRATEKRLYGLIEPLHFYSLIFDLEWPPHRRR